MRFWSDGDISTLRTMWKAGASGSVIGARLKRSRGAVLGKLNRLGLLGLTTEERSRRLSESIRASWVGADERKRALGLRAARQNRARAAA